MKYINGKAYKKTEMHMHLLPVSVCGRMEAEEAAEKYAACGYDALVLTNHYSRAYIDTHSATEAQWREAYVEHYHAFRKIAEKHGLEVIFGAEVTLQSTYIPLYREWWSQEFIERNYADYLVYGMTEEIFRNTPLLCDLLLPELRKICDENGLLLLQAHPFRVEQRHSLKDIRLLDGLEINGKESFPSGPHEEEILRLARENGLVVTCGGDTHGLNDYLRSATYIPAEVHDTVALAQYLREVKIPYYSLDEFDPTTPSNRRW